VQAQDTALVARRRPAALTVHSGTASGRAGHHVLRDLSGPDARRDLGYSDLTYDVKTSNATDLTRFMPKQTAAVSGQHFNWAPSLPGVFAGLPAFRSD
jgi:hypothetical protein